MKKGDFIIIGIGLTIMLMMFIGYRIFISNLGDDRQVTVRYKGQEIYRIDLDDTINKEILVIDGEVIDIIDRNDEGEKNREFVIDGDHYNIIQIKDGYISAIEADCPSQDDVIKPPTNRPYDVILCAPHYLEVYIIATPVDDGLIDGEV